MKIWNALRYLEDSTERSEGMFVPILLNRTTGWFLVFKIFSDLSRRLLSSSPSPNIVYVYVPGNLSSSSFIISILYSNPLFFVSSAIVTRRIELVMYESTLG